MRVHHVVVASHGLLNQLDHRTDGVLKVVIHDQGVIAPALIQSGHADEAEQGLRHVLASNPKNADAHNLLGADTWERRAR